MSGSHRAFRALVRDFGPYPISKGKLLEFTVECELISSAFKKQSSPALSSRKIMQATLWLLSSHVKYVKKVKINFNILLNPVYLKCYNFNM